MKIAVAAGHADDAVRGVDGGSRDPAFVDCFGDEDAVTGELSYGGEACI